MTSVLAKNAGKAIIHVTKINYLVAKLYEVFSRLQAFRFFYVGNQSRNPKKTNFALSGNRSEHRFHVRSRVPL